MLAKSLKVILEELVCKVGNISFEILSGLTAAVVSEVSK